MNLETATDAELERRLTVCQNEKRVYAKLVTEHSRIVSSLVATEQQYVAEECQIQAELGRRKKAEALRAELGG